MPVAAPLTGPTQRALGSLDAVGMYGGVGAYGGVGLYGAVGLLGALGALVGAATARALRRGRRPATVSARWCTTVTGSLWALVGLRWVDGNVPGWWLPVPLTVAALAVPLAAADLAHRRLPDVLTLPACPVAVVAVALAAGYGPGLPLVGRALAGAMIFAGGHALVRVAAPGWLGAGDVKLAGSLGAVLGAVGWAALVTAALAGAVLTAVLASAAVFPRWRHWRSGVPHGPGLLTATCLVVLFPGAALERL